MLWVATVGREMVAGSGKGVKVKAVPGGSIVQEERYQFILVALFPLAPGYITIVSIISHHLFTFVLDMRTHGSDPFAAEVFLFPDVYEDARDLLKRDNPAVVILYAERSEDTLNRGNQISG
jgi:hypothetical protein